MGDNYLLQVDKDEELAVRLVGIINEKECEAFLNTEDAVRKVSTAGSITIDESANAYGKRFVIVVRVKSVAFGTSVPVIFISPIINQVSYLQGNREFRCNEGGKDHSYRFIPLENRTKS